jgi:hypothetical protein
MQPIEADARLHGMHASPPDAACGCCAPTAHRLHRREHLAQAPALPDARTEPEAAVVSPERERRLVPHGFQLWLVMVSGVVLGTISVIMWRALS